MGFSLRWRLLLWSSAAGACAQDLCSRDPSTGSMLGAHGPGSPLHMGSSWIRDQSRVYCFSPVNLSLQTSLSSGLGKVLVGVSWFSFPTELLSWISITLPQDSAEVVAVLLPKSCPSLCDRIDCSMPGSSVLLHLQEFHIHFHRVGDAIQPSHPLPSPSPPAFNLSQHQGLFQ